MPASADNHYDALVIGGGPAGCCTAANLARQGISVLVIEGKRFPREHIGESLLAVSMPVLTELGMLTKLHAAGFPRKQGAVFIWGSTDREILLDMPHPGYAFQVLRARFDQLLLEHARELGAQVWQEQWVRQPIWDSNGRMAGLVVHDQSGTPRRLTSRFVIDASGLFQFLPRRLELPIQLFGPKRVAITAYYRGARRHDAPYHDDIVSEASADGWIWFIPLGDDLTSVGFVGDEVDLDGSPAEMLQRQIAGSRLVRRLLASATVARRARVLKYTNHMVRGPLWGNGYLLVGDTAIFVDPLFSTGVHGSLHSASLAAAALTSVMEGTLPEAEAAAWYDQEFRAHYRRVRCLIRLLYGIHPGPSRFWRSRDLSNITEGDAEELTQGLGAEGMLLFGGALVDDLLTLPKPVAQRMPEFIWRVRPRRIRLDECISLGPEIQPSASWMRQRGRLVPAVALRHRRARTREVCYPIGGFPDRLLQALDGSRSLAAAIQLARPTSRERERAPLLVGALVDGGLLASRRPCQAAAARTLAAASGDRGR
jgi:halogenation protein CepH